MIINKPLKLPVDCFQIDRSPTIHVFPLRSQNLVYPPLNLCHLLLKRSDLTIHLFNSLIYFSLFLFQLRHRLFTILYVHGLITVYFKCSNLLLPVFNILVQLPRGLPKMALQNALCFADSSLEFLLQTQFFHVGS